MVCRGFIGFISVYQGFVGLSLRSYRVLLFFFFLCGLWGLGVEGLLGSW